MHNNKIKYFIFFSLLISSLYLLTGCRLNKIIPFDEVRISVYEFEPFAGEEYLAKKRELSKKDKKKIEKSFRKRNHRND